MSNLIYYCSIASVACIWYIDFLSRPRCLGSLAGVIFFWKAPETNPRYQDLAFLRREVCSALRCGQILPGAEDDASEAYGPSIYTVNEQYIKPVTQQADKMSWA